MPIVDRRVAFFLPQRNGKNSVREDHTDARGNVHPHFYYTDRSRAEVEADMNARVIDLAGGDIQAVIAFTEQGTIREDGQFNSAFDPDQFDYTDRDIDLQTAEEEVLKEFARRDGETSMDLAAWVNDIGTSRWNAITGRLGWSNSADEIGDRVQSRAIALVPAIPFFWEREKV